MQTQTAPRKELSNLEQEALAKAEHAIRGAHVSHFEMGRALREIRDGWLYRGTHPNFDEYLISRWDMKRARGYQLIAAFEVFEMLKAHTAVDKLPTNERQVRPLARLKNERQRRTAWTIVTKRAEQAGARIATDLVEAVVKEMLGEDDNDDALVADIGSLAGEVGQAVQTILQAIEDHKHEIRSQPLLPQWLKELVFDLEWLSVHSEHSNSGAIPEPEQTETESDLVAKG